MKIRGPLHTRRETLVAAAAALVAALALVLYGAGALEGLERQSIDQRFAIRGTQTPGDQIVIVGIDQTTLATLNTQPSRMPRASYGKVLDHIRASSPRMIGIDRQFIGRTDPENDDALLAAIARDGPILLATHDGPDGPIAVPAGVTDAPGVVLGSSAVDTDPDNVLRKMLYAPVSLETPSFAVRAAELFRNQPVDESDFPDNHAWIDFRGPAGTFPHYSFVDVLADKVPPSAFTGKVVLIGVTDPVDDIFVTSASRVPMPGVEVHANAVWTALAGVPLKPAGPAVDVALIIAMIGIPAAIAIRKSGLVILAGSLGLLVVLLGAAQLAFNWGWIVALTYPLAGLAVTTFAMIAVDAYMQQRQRAALEQTLGDLLPPQTPPAFFISYRRSQNTWQARDIRRELTRRYGDASVFMDTSSIDYGEAFPDRIASAIRGCSVMFILIGPHWIEPVDGSRRIDNADDWVRREIEAGLQRKEAVIVPVLLDGAQAPSADELPEPLKGLASLHAVSVVGDDLTADIDNLLKSIERARRRAAVERGGGLQPAAPQPD